MLAKQNSTFTRANNYKQKYQRKNTTTKNTNLIAFVSYFETFDEFMHRKVKILMGDREGEQRVRVGEKCFLNSVSYRI